MWKITTPGFTLQEPQPWYMDYYERLLFNHRLGTIDPETGTTPNNRLFPAGGRWVLQNFRQAF